MTFLRVTLRLGDLATQRAAALITSANDSLVGNRAPTYWRFISRLNADGAIRKLGGAELEDACLAIEPTTTPVRRDITRWTSGVKVGPSAVVRCPAGSAVATRAGGALQCDHVVHAVAPDSEFGYEGQYTGGERDTELSGVDGRRRSERDFPQFSPPDALLLSAYTSALAEASRVGASDVACAAIGTGVKGWKAGISAALGIEAAARLAAAHAAADAGAGAGGGVRHVAFVIGGAPAWAEPTWRDWVRVAAALLGEPRCVGEARTPEEAKRVGGELSWELDGQAFAQQQREQRRRSVDGAHATLGSGSTAATPASQPSLLPLETLGEIRELLANRERGFSGVEIPLTPEQELRAERRRVMGPAAPS